MRNFKRKTFIYVSLILLSIMTLIGFGANQVQAANLGDGSFSVSYSSIDTYYGKEAPEYTEPGYLFAGWYEDEECTISYVKKDGETLSQYYAKFVPQDVLSVKAQNATTLHNKLLENTDVGKIRFVTSVDSLYYSEVGLHIEGKIGTHTLDKDYVVKQVYTHLYVVDTENDKSDARTAQQVFELDSAEYFAPYTFKINFTQFADGFTITPYWKTPDGVRVDGVTRTRSMIDNLEDGSCAQVNDRGFYTSNNLNAIVDKLEKASIMGTEDEPTVITLLKDVEISETITTSTYGYTKITNYSNKPVTISKASAWNREALYCLLVTKDNTLIIEGADDKDSITIDGANQKQLIRNEASTLIVKNATLKNGNIATTNPTTEAAIGSGGAINNLAGSTYQIDNCKFQNNYANNIGGAISIASDSDSSVVKNSEFLNNQAVYGGAAIYSTTTLKVTNCDFQSNGSSETTTTTNGGAIMLNSTNGTGTVTASKFYGNKATNGGALNIPKGTLNIISCEFGTIGDKESGNEATAHGGAIYVSGGIANLTVDKQYESKSLNYNKATNGGAIYVHSGSASMTGYDFTSNSASTSGGAIYSRASLMVTGGNFEGNKAMGDNGIGGAICLLIQNNSGTVTGAAFYDNSATNGGALGISQATLNIISCEIGKKDSGNTATNGGAIFIGGSGAANLTVDSQDTNKSLNYNTATLGGAICNTLGSVSVSGYTFTNNSATSDGGAIYTKSSLDIDACEFKSNTSNADGGAIMLDTVNGSGTVTASKFYQNKAINGGALSIEAATLNVTSCELGKENLANTATTNGGAIYVGSGAANLTVDNQYEYKSLNYNEATSGGAIYVNAGAASVDGYTFTNNSASTSGGAIYSKAELDVTNCDFESNGSNASKTTATGGAIMLETLSGDGTVTASRFYKNSATNGGALGVFQGTLNIVSCEIGQKNAANSATTNGGAIYVVGSGTVTLGVDDNYTYKSLNYNTATLGGAIMVASGSVSATGYTFEGNEATKSGGAIFGNSSTTTGATSCSFISNKANGGHGGAIHSKSTLNVNACIFESNTSTGYGGAIMQEGSGCLGTVSATDLYKNTAVNGGAVGCSSATLTLTNCAFVKLNEDGSIEGNNATSNGAVACVTGANGTIQLLIEDGRSRDCQATSADYDNLDKSSRTIFATQGAIIQLDKLYQNVVYFKGTNANVGTITLVD